MYDSSDSIDKFLDYVNNKHPNISFTCDKEQNDTLSFLYISIKRYSVPFKPSIYRKPTFTCLISKYYDFPPKQYKENFICTLISKRLPNKVRLFCIR